MPAKKKTPARKKTTAGRKKKTTGKKTTARKKTTAAKKKTTAAAGSIPKSALIKARKMRKAGKPWPAIRKATGYRATQLRPALRAAGMDDVLGRSSSGGTKKTAAKKKTTGKKTVAKKKTAAKKTAVKKAASKKTTKKKLPKKTKKLNKIGDKVNLKKLSNDEVVDAVVGKKVTFKRNIDDKKPRTFVVKSAKVVKKKSKNFGRVIMLKTGADGSYSVPIDWIIRIG